MRTIYRTSRVHSCHSIELGEQRPLFCRCRKNISRAEAVQLVESGEAMWLLDYSTELPTPLWDICLTGRRVKVPRSPSLERAHIMRSTELSDGGSFARSLEDLDTHQEIVDRFDNYRDLELTERILLFHSVGKELLLLKKQSDQLGILSGPEGKHLVSELIQKANELKFNSFVPGPEGPVFSYIGVDERTKF